MKPYYEENGITIYHGDCREILPHLPKVDLVLTDPPYGIGKADWDGDYLDWVESECLKAGRCVCIIPGIWALGKCIYAMGDYYRWTVAGYKPAAMTNGSIGLNKWQPAVLGGTVPRTGADAFTFKQTGEGKQGHPCQKPLAFINWLVYKLTSDCGSILDPFMGSGTTLVAAKELGRKAIGIEISKAYCDIAVQRLAQGVLPLETPRVHNSTLPLDIKCEIVENEA
jgi:DNA modification methylase